MKKYKKIAKLAHNNQLKTRIEWIILLLLVLIIPLGIWLNLFAYEFNYLRCQDKPTEVFGNYYRTPYDKGYGIHPGSDYSNCSYAAPEGKIRDPSTVAGAPMKTNTQVSKPEYDVYIPDGYVILGSIANPEANGQETSFSIKTDSGTLFRVREMNKDSDFSYTNLCTRPATENWSGTVVGKDRTGRDICKTNLSKYIKDYIVGVNIGRTGIMLQTPLGSEESLNTEAMAIFSSMKPYINNK